MYSEPSKKEVLVGGIPLTVYVLEDGSWALNDEMVAAAYGIKNGTVRRYRMKFKGVRFTKEVSIELMGRPHWTRAGLIEIGVHARSDRAKSLIAALGEVRHHTTRIEPSIREVVVSAFKGILQVEPQYVVSNFRIDIYFPTIKLAVEIDENGHEGYNSEQERSRQQVIEAQLGCKFIRWNPYQSSQNVGTLVNLILRHLARNKAA